MAGSQSDRTCEKAVGAFVDFCAEFGYEADSIKALQTFRRCASFGKRLRAFFTPAEIEALSEIQ